MKPSILVLFLASLSASLAYAKCGDNTCGLSENTRSCPADCKSFTKSTAQMLVDNGPAIRGSSDGSGMLVGSVSIEKSETKLTLKRYDDKLALIQESSILSRSVDGRGGLGNPHPVRGPDGSIYVAFRDHDTSDAANPKYKLRVVRSRDNGKTWDFSGENEGIIDTASVGIWEPFLFFDQNNQLRVVYAKEREGRTCSKQRGEKQDIVTRVSADSGKSWGQESVVSGEGISRDGVPSVARLQDGSFIAVFESWQGSECGKANPNLLIRSMQSVDGVSWTNRSIVFDPYRIGKIKSIASWPYVGVLQDGRAVVSFTSNFPNIKDIDRSDIAPEKLRNFDIFFMTSNGGARFKSLGWDVASLKSAYRYDRDANTSNRYSSFVTLKDGRVVVFSGLPNRFTVFAQ